MCNLRYIPMHKFTLEIHRHYYVIHNDGGKFDPHLQSIFVGLLEKYTIVNTFNKNKFRKTFFKSNVKPVIKKYASNALNFTEFRFNINTLPELLKVLNNYHINQKAATINYVTPNTTRKLNVTSNEAMTPRVYQVPYIDYLVNKEYPTKLLDLQTGTGKTYIALKSICDLNLRTVIIILPRYIDKWIGDITTNTNATVDDIVSIKGSSQLLSYMDMVKTGDVPPFTIISNRTYLNYIKDYEANYGVSEDVSTFSYPLAPDELFTKGEYGILLIDEVHQDFTGCFKISLYSNIKYIIGLSATLESMDYKQTAMYSVLFPHENRFIKPKYDKYIHVYGIGYKIRHNLLKVQYLNSNHGAYSHIKYEKFIMRCPTLLKDYLSLIEHYVDTGYIHRKKNDDKLIIFAASVKMCSIITDYLADIYRTLDVRRMVEDDPYENLIEPDIRVTTILSGGTAVDIPNLITTIQTVSVYSVQSNKQSLGRLRKIDGVDVRFYYLFNPAIRAHRKYNVARVEQFKSIVYRIEQIIYSTILG